MWIFSSCLKMVVATFYWVSVIVLDSLLLYLLFPSTKIDMVSTIFHSFIQQVFVSDIYIYLYLIPRMCPGTVPGAKDVSVSQTAPQNHILISLHFHKRDRWRSGSLWGSDKPRLHAWWWKRESMQLDLPDSKPVPFALYHQFICWKRV